MMHELHPALLSWLPVFPTCKCLEISDLAALSAWTDRFPAYSDFDAGSLWSWDYRGKIQLSRLHGNLVLLLPDYTTGEPYFTFLGERRCQETAIELLRAGPSLGLSHALRFVPQSVVVQLDQRVLQIDPDPDNHDYIAQVASLASYDGPEFAEKRRHASMFSRKVPSHQVVPIDVSAPACRKDIERLVSLWNEEKGRRSQVQDNHEHLAIMRCLDAASELNIIAFGTFCDDVMAAFWILGEKSKATCISHFEKADTSRYPGIFPHFKREVARQLLAMDKQSINLEQDLGIAGLRRSKRSYARGNMLLKHRVTLRDPTTP